MNMREWGVFYVVEKQNFKWLMKKPIHIEAHPVIHKKFNSSCDCISSNSLKTVTSSMERENGVDSGLAMMTEF